MCTNPITIPRKSGIDNSSRFSRFYPSSAPKYLGDSIPKKNDLITVPCGKCVECLKTRQNDLACRCVREAQKFGSMSFVTLTYEDKYLPLSITLRRWDKETGEFVDCTSPEILVEDGTPDSVEFVKSCRGAILGLPSGPFPRRYSIEAPFNGFDDFYYEYVITPSLSRRDVRLWLKSSRVRFEREFGHKLPEFSYVVVGEYGPKTCRPHYHLAFFGLPFKTVIWLCSQWQYGFTNYKDVNAVNEDGSNGFELASRYIGKYMSKGKFECDSVKCKQAQKPRLCLSKHLGSDVSPELVHYFRCYDLFGEYDIVSCKLVKSGEYLSENQFKVLSDEIKKRNKFSVPSANGVFSFRLPMCLIKKIWYVKTAENVYKASPLRLALQFASRPMSWDIYLRKFQANSKDFSQGQISSLVSQFESSEFVALSLREQSQSESLSFFYARSIF